MKQVKTWINDIKIAILEKDFKKIEMLNSSMPKFESLDHMQEAQALIAEAIRILQIEKNSLRKNMKNLKDSRKFFNEQRANNFSATY